MPEIFIYIGKIKECETTVKENERISARQVEWPVLDTEVT
jgi:hypothetical protein